MPDTELKIGSIILAEVREPNGKPVGPHPAIVLNPNAEIAAGDDLRVAVCSTSFDYPLPSGWFAVPHIAGGDPTTGLAEACVAKATWIEVIPQKLVIKIYGRAPSRIYRQIENWLRDKQRQMKSGIEPDDAN